MGNTEQKSARTTEVDSFHEKFKRIKIVENSEQMILSIAYEQKSDIEEWQKLLKSVKECDPEFLLMPKKYMIAEEGICGSSGVIKVVYDSFTYSFEEEIRNHSQKYKHFQEPEVWYLLFAMISSVKEMDRLSMKVGDIRPYNIFVNENGQVKLAGVYSWPSEVENFLKTSYDKTVTYLAPEELNQCRIGERGKKTHIVGESFSIGLTLLHTCLLKPMDELYNLKKFEFNVQRLDYQINQLRNVSFWNEQKEKNEKYSKELVNIIIGLLDMNENKRLTSLQLFDQLQPHAQQILNLREFQVPSLQVSTPTKPAQQQSSSSNIPNSTSNHTSNPTTHPRPLSPQYSSIQRKDYNQPQSLAFDVGNNFVIPSRAVPINQSTNAGRLTPEKSGKSKEKMRVSLSSGEKVNGGKGNRTVEREGVSREKMAGQMGGVGRGLTEGGKVVGYGEYGMGNHYTTQEFNVLPESSQFQSFRPSIGSTITTTNPNNSNNYNMMAPQYAQYGQKKFQIPFTTTSHPTPTYTSYQPTPQFTIPPAQYNTASYQAPSSYQAPPSSLPYYSSQPANFTYKPPVAQIASTFVPTSIGGYPFSQNVDLTKSQYTLIEKGRSFGGEEHRGQYEQVSDKGFVGVGNSINGQQVTMIPRLQQQVSFTTGVSSVPLSDNYRPIGGDMSIGGRILDTTVGRTLDTSVGKPSGGESSDLLKKIEEQLNKSKQMYPTSSKIVR